jgi:hypothetical protein
MVYSIIEMNQLKRFLRGDIDWVDPFIIKKLEQYDTIQVDSTMYQTSDIIQKIKEGCPHCISLKGEISALKFQLKKLSAPEVPPIKILLQKFFNEKFKRTKGREYSRKQLFRDVNVYLKQFNLQIMYNTDAGWRYLIEEVIKDTSNNYRKLKIRRRLTLGSHSPNCISLND